MVAIATAIQCPFTFYNVNGGSGASDWSTSHNYDYWNKNFTSSVGVNNYETKKNDL